MVNGTDMRAHIPHTKPFAGRTRRVSNQNSHCTHQHTCWGHAYMACEPRTCSFCRHTHHPLCQRTKQVTTSWRAGLLLVHPTGPRAVQPLQVSRPSDTRWHAERASLLTALSRQRPAQAEWYKNIKLYSNATCTLRRGSWL